MDFDGAIKAHAEWKMKLSNYIRKPDGSLKPDVVGQDNQCALGKWLYGEGAKYSTHNEYKQLKEEHAKFHKAAAEIIKKADAGTNVTEDIALGASSDYNKVSTGVTRLIMEMKRKAG